MKTLWLSAFVFSFAASAQAAPALKPAADSNDGCKVGRSLHRVVYTLPLGPQCCGGELRCTQLLSTTILPRRLKDSHT